MIRNIYKPQDIFTFLLLYMQDCKKFHINRRPINIISFQSIMSLVQDKHTVVERKIKLLNAVLCKRLA
jgi:hypothetical protein